MLIEVCFTIFSAKPCNLKFLVFCIESPLKQIEKDIKSSYSPDAEDRRQVKSSYKVTQPAYEAYNHEDAAETSSRDSVNLSAMKITSFQFYTDNGWCFVVFAKYYLNML